MTVQKHITLALIVPVLFLIDDPRQKALREYSPEKYYDRLMAMYEKAIEFGSGGTS